jgi:transposase
VSSPASQSGILRFLETIDHTVSAELDIHLIPDNQRTHKAAQVRRWFVRHPRFHVHFTPTSVSWLNPVERWFATLTEKQIKRGAHRSARALETAIREDLTISNETQKPFVWTQNRRRAHRSDKVVLTGPASDRASPGRFTPCSTV